MHRDLQFNGNFSYSDKLYIHLCPQGLQNKCERQTKFSQSLMLLKCTGLPFEYWPRNGISLVTIFYHILPNPFQFIVQQSSYHSKTYGRRYCSKRNRKQWEQNPEMWGRTLHRRPLQLKTAVSILGRNWVLYSTWFRSEDREKNYTWLTKPKNRHVAEGIKITC